ncbi:MAG: Gfo/Idh/MocA family oxidoreductase [Planctomycetaceae bacterium]|jgi:predicted dehydrogenase|nr:Gfo/Idh/MocA family oxidoreductase [Planctomycetaceae bacterium]
MKHTRRTFFKTAAAVSVPLFIPQCVSAAANEKIGIAFIGAGLRSTVVSGSFGRDQRTKILYVADPDLNRGEKLAGIIEKRQKLRPQVLSDFRQALDDQSVDGIYCGSCNHWHALTALWAMNAGKHCYIEKPLTYDIAEGKMLTATAKKTGIVFQTGTQRRSTTNVNELVAFIKNGGIGDVKLARIVGYRPRTAIGALGNYPIPKGIDYDFWTGPAPLKPLTRKEFHYDWHWQRIYGNGDLGNQCSHRLDISHWALGVNGFPQSVFTYGGRLGYDVETKNPNYIDAGDTANTSVTIYNYGEKSIVCEVRGLPSPPLYLPVGNKVGTIIGIIFYGSKGYGIQAPVGKGNIYSVSYAYDLQGRVIKEFKSIGTDGKMTSSDDATDRHVANFFDAIVANDPKKVTADARCGEISAALAHLGNISYYLGEKNKVSVDELKRTLQTIKSADDNDETLMRTVKHIEAYGVDLKRTPLSLGAMLNIDTDKETFIGNTEANKLMSREESRKGFEL